MCLREKCCGSGPMHLQRHPRLLVSAFRWQRASFHPRLTGLSVSLADPGVKRHPSVSHNTAATLWLWDCKADIRTPNRYQQVQRGMLQLKLYFYSTFYFSTINAFISFLILSKECDVRLKHLSKSSGKRWTLKICRCTRWAHSTSQQSARQPGRRAV